ncbi:translation initiation factor eIF-2B subunit alpha-like [Limulus polyphemus]|uniref:Translation initiation factor eIF2B subunit alpha n=1 Tax=Limulus polyphemus TaxID=6850 RepID=A0ABM1C549_LIMPO|nr:translation initiation factor eIF-2B subunit alpha-like [Limulus polyphemus]
MGTEKLVDCFENFLKQDPSLSAAVAALHTLMTVMEEDTSETVTGLRENLVKANDTLIKFSQVSSSISIRSAFELFLRFITLTVLDHKDFRECKEVLSNRGKQFLEKLGFARPKIAKLGHPFILDGSIILTHSYSRVVLDTLLEAAKAKKRFQVYVTESCPDNAGHKMCEQLGKKGIVCTVILDAAIGYIMEKVDVVLVGAEGVVESGGIINKIGTYPMAVCAREINKPFYVLAESFKFVRLYPLNQEDIPNNFKYLLSESQIPEDINQTNHPFVDYTPPSYISLLFTDLGVLTPSAVSDELIKLYL